MSAGLLPSSIATMYNLVVCNLDNNVLTGTLDDFAFQTIANREDLHSRLRYLDLGNKLLCRCGPASPACSVVAALCAAGMMRLHSDKDYIV